MANKTRDEMVRARGELLNEGTAGRTDHWKPVMKIDKQGIPHDFCTTIRGHTHILSRLLKLTIISGNSEFMANEVSTWIDDIIAAHDKALLQET